MANKMNIFIHDFIKNNFPIEDFYNVRELQLLLSDKYNKMHNRFGDDAYEFRWDILKSHLDVLVENGFLVRKELPQEEVRKNSRVKYGRK